MYVCINLSVTHSSYITNLTTANNCIH